MGNLSSRRLDDEIMPRRRVRGAGVCGDLSEEKIRGARQRTAPTRDCQGI